jgi:hypothetical protein
LLQKATVVDLKHGQKFTPPVQKPVAPGLTKGGFARANASALGRSAGLSAVNGVATAINNLAFDMAMKDVTNEQTDPTVALQELQYLRQRFNEPKGVIYAGWAVVTGTAREKMLQQEEGNEWIDTMEVYWNSRHDEAFRQLLPALGSAAPLQ